MASPRSRYVSSTTLALYGAAAYSALGAGAYLLALLLSNLDPDTGFFAGLLAILPALPWWPLLAAGHGSAHWPLWVGYALNTGLTGMYVLRAALRNPA